MKTQKVLQKQVYKEYKSYLRNLDGNEDINKKNSLYLGMYYLNVNNYLFFEMIKQ